MIIQHNLEAMNSNRILSQTTTRQKKSSEKLSSGYKVNRSADDAAGLSISEKMRAQIRGLNQASMNSQDGVSLIQVAEGALDETHSILQRMNELATQAANDINASVDRNSIKDELSQLTLEIDRIASTTEFNNMVIFNGKFKDIKLQVGAKEGQNISMSLYAIDAHGIGLNMPFTNPSDIDMVLSRPFSIKNIGSTDETMLPYEGFANYDASSPTDKAKYNPDNCLMVDNNENAGRTMQIIQNAIKLVSEQRSSLGAIQNRLEHTINNLNNISENTSAAESRIRDTDMADEMVSYSKDNILAQAGQSLLAKANQSKEGIISLLQ